MRKREWLFLCLMAAVAGNAVGTVRTWMAVNRMLTVGFTMTDPEGYVVDQFDTLPTMPWQYWTEKPVELENMQNFVVEVD